MANILHNKPTSMMSGYTYWFLHSKGHGIIDAMKDNDADTKMAGRSCHPSCIGPLYRATIERYLLAAG